MVMLPVDIKLWLYFNELPLKMQKRRFHVLLMNKTRPIVMWTKYPCLPLKTDNTTPKLEKASLTTCSLMNSGRKKVTKISSLPSLKGPTGLPKLRHISEPPKRYLRVSPSLFLIQRPKQTLKGKVCTEHLSLSLPQTLEYEKYPILKSFLEGFHRGQYIAKQWFNLSSVTLLQRLVPNSSCSRVLQASGFGSWFSSGAKTQSSSEGRIKLNIHYVMTAYVGVIRTHWLLS